MVIRFVLEPNHRNFWNLEIAVYLSRVLVRHYKVCTVRESLLRMVLSPCFIEGVIFWLADVV